MPALYRYSIILDKMLVIPFSVSMLEIFTIQKPSFEATNISCQSILKLPYENLLFKNAACLLMFSRILSYVVAARYNTEDQIDIELKVTILGLQSIFRDMQGPRKIGN